MPRWISLSTALVLLCCGPTNAGEPAYRDDLRFVEALRQRGDNDLALEFLKRLQKNASAELLRELPLEMAKTALRVAGDEPEMARRLALYKEARADFQKFIAANPRHPRRAEANLDIARVLNLLGKTELNRALLAEDARTKKELAGQARATLVEASAQLRAAGKALAEQLTKLPSPDGIDDPKKKKETPTARSRLEDELKQTQLEEALNLYDQAATYIGGTGDEAASRLLLEAKALLDPLAQGLPTHPITWKAKAWLGRIIFETETADKAREQFLTVLNATSPAAAEGIRLARYFRLLVLRAKPTADDVKKGVNAILLDATRRWRKDYARFRETSEGYGVSFLMAQTLLNEADTNKRLGAGQANTLRSEARTLLREVENSENEFTERARRLKIETMTRQGLFQAAIGTLKTFEDCYVRAQFEALQLAQEAKDGKQDEAKRKAHVDRILQALERGLALPAVKKMRPNMELNNARAMLAYWSLHAGKLAEAIRVGEAFARDDPRSGQAEMAAVYALEAYSQLIGQKRAKFEEAPAERAGLFGLAAYMEGRWPNGLGGELARHTVGLQLLREENFPEAIKKLSLIGPGYGNYTLACFQLADAALKAERGSVEPITGDRPGDYRKRALAALEAMPASALGSDPTTNTVHVQGKAILGRELYRSKRYAQMDELATKLLARLNALRFHDDDDKDQATRNQLRFELIDIQLFARYGLADAAFQAGEHARAAELLDPLVDAVGKGADSPQKANLQKNPQLSAVILSIALKANIQLGKIDRTDLVLDVMDRVTAEGGEGGATDLLKLLAFLIRGQLDELRKRGDQDELARAIKGYAAILDKRIARQKKLTPDFIRVLAECYSSMAQHDKAAAELAKVTDPQAKPGTPEDMTYRAVQVLLARELRLSKTPESRQKARAILDGVMGTDAKPGWGRRNITALKENGLLLEAEEKWAEGFKVWSQLTKNLARNAVKGGADKEHYLECYYHMVLCYLKFGLGKPAQEDRDRAVRQAALQIVNLERAWDEFGSDASKKRFTELLAAEPLLREQYEAAKKKK